MYFIKVKPGRNPGEFPGKIRQLMNEMAHLSRPLISTTSAGWTPETDMYETETEVIVVVNLGGVLKEDIDVSFHEHFLRIKGTRNRILPRDVHARYHRMEIGAGGFERLLRIPVPVDQERIKASFADGFLTVTMTKGTGSRLVPVKARP